MKLVLAQGRDELEAIRKLAPIFVPPIRFRFILILSIAALPIALFALHAAHQLSSEWSVLVFLFVVLSIPMILMALQVRKADAGIEFAHDYIELRNWFYRLRILWPELVRIRLSFGGPAASNTEYAELWLDQEDKKPVKLLLYNRRDSDLIPLFSALGFRAEANKA